MKKTILSLILFCAVCLSALAGSSIKVIHGDKHFLRKATGEAVLKIDWTDATYDYGMPLSEKFPTFAPFDEASWTGFNQEFSENCHTLRLVRQSTSARYLITIKVHNVDQYIKVFSVIPGPATKVWSTVTITDQQTGEDVVIIRANEVDGGASPSPFESFSDSFEELGEEVADRLQ